MRSDWCGRGQMVAQWMPIPPTPLAIAAAGRPTSPSASFGGGSTRNRPGNTSCRESDPESGPDVKSASGIDCLMPASGPWVSNCAAPRSVSVMLEVWFPRIPGIAGPTSTIRIRASGAASPMVRAYIAPAGPEPTTRTSTTSPIGALIGPPLARRRRRPPRRCGQSWPTDLPRFPRTRQRVDRCNRAR